MDDLRLQQKIVEAIDAQLEAKGVWVPVMHLRAAAEDILAIPEIAQALALSRRQDEWLEKNQ